MIRFRRAVVGAVLGGSLMAGTASASTPTFTDVFDPADVLFDNAAGTCVGTNNAGTATDSVTGFVSGKCTTLGYSHSLTGFTSPPDTLSSATLTLYFYDDLDTGSATEKVTVTLNGVTLVTPSGGFTITSGSVAGAPDSPSYNVIGSVSSAGVLNLLISRQAGDFYFAKSELFGEWAQGTTNGATNGSTLPPVVPEPATFVLLGSGLLAASRLRRLRSR